MAGRGVEGDIKRSEPYPLVSAPAQAQRHASCPGDLNDGTWRGRGPIGQCGEEGRRPWWGETKGAERYDEGEGRGGERAVPKLMKTRWRQSRVRGITPMLNATSRQIHTDPARKKLKDAKRVVVKVGTAVVANSDGTMSLSRMGALVEKVIGGNIAMLILTLHVLFSGSFVSSSCKDEKFFL
eukprot:768667-Hanusia_phi.AAC.10